MGAGITTRCVLKRVVDVHTHWDRWFHMRVLVTEYVHS